jgi:hypothetical protein
MIDVYGQTVEVGDYVICSPLWGSTKRDLVIAKVKRTATKKVEIDLADTYSDVLIGQAKWIENFVKVPEEWAVSFYKKSLDIVQSRYPNYKIAVRC